MFGSTPAANSATNNYGEIVQIRYALNDDFSSVSRKIKNVLHFRTNKLN